MNAAKERNKEIYLIRTLRNKGKCRICGESFGKNSPSQKYCEFCTPSYGKAIKFDALKLKELQEQAKTAFSKVYTAEEYSQEFLRRLIP